MVSLYRNPADANGLTEFSLYSHRSSTKTLLLNSSSDKLPNLFNARFRGGEGQWQKHHLIPAELFGFKDPRKSVYFLPKLQVDGYWSIRDGSANGVRAPSEQGLANPSCDLHR